MNNIPIEIWLTAKDCELLVQKDYKWDVNVSTTKLRRNIGDDCIVKFISEESHIAAIKGATSSIQKLYEITDAQLKDRIATTEELRDTIEKLKNKEQQLNERISALLDNRITQIAAMALQGMLAAGLRYDEREMCKHAIGYAKQLNNQLGHE